MQYISVFEMLKIGVGPSSSHTMGPWYAANTFIKKIQHKLPDVVKMDIHLYGSLSKTGVGHGTDIAIQLGLMGADVKTFDTSNIVETIQQIHQTQQLVLAGEHNIAFAPERDIHFENYSLPYHANGMKLTATFANGNTIEETYYSLGGGFICTEKESSHTMAERTVPYNFYDADTLLNFCHTSGMAISALALQNEYAIASQHYVHENIQVIWQTMLQCMYKGCHTAGTLPGGLNVKRRAKEMYENRQVQGAYANENEWQQVITQQKIIKFAEINNWISCFALAVNEENAAFGRVVTAPTNGSAGVVPAVLMYALCFCESESQHTVRDFLATASAIGSLFKHKATLSAAMGGCQAEIGVSASMAAGALCEVLGGTPSQVMMAAEIAMEHHLGLTCDPVAGLVQIPCIERNSMGAIKAITAANIALESDATHAKVSLNDVIETMWSTAKDMNAKYKETSEGGLALAVNIAEC